MASAPQSAHNRQQPTKDIRSLTLGYEFCKRCGAWHHESGHHKCGFCIAKVRPKLRRFDKLLADVRAARSKR